MGPMEGENWEKRKGTGGRRKSSLPAFVVDKVSEPETMDGIGTIPYLHVTHCIRLQLSKSLCLPLWVSKL